VIARVRRIETAYDARGMIDTVTSYSDTSGTTAVDQVAYTYDGWGNLTEYEQDFDGVIGAGGRPAVSITYAYGASNGVDDVPTRVATVTLTPSGSSAVQVAAYEYPSSKPRHHVLRAPHNLPHSSHPHPCSCSRLCTALSTASTRYRSASTAWSCPSFTGVRLRGSSTG